MKTLLKLGRLKIVFEPKRKVRPDHYPVIFDVAHVKEWGESLNLKSMKNLLFLIMLLPLGLFAQEDSTTNKVCLERGHVQGALIMKTDMYCEPYFIDEENRTIMVYPACNYESFVCQRCGEHITQLEKERRIVTWKGTRLDLYIEEDIPININNYIEHQKRYFVLPLNDTVYYNLKK